MDIFKKNRLFSKVMTYLILITGTCIMLFPFYWMVISSMKSPDEIIKFPPTLIPESKFFMDDPRTGERERVEVLGRTEGQVRVKVVIGLNIGKEYMIPKEKLIKKRFILENYARAWKAAPFPLYFLNNVLMAGGVTFFQIITSLLAAFAFAKLHFPLKKPLFLFLIATLMVPGELLLIPNYIILARLGWINTFYALIVPHAAQVFGIYFLMQYFETLPHDLFDAAVVDGCTPMTVLTRIVIPLSRAAILTTALITFIGSWNSLLWPLIVTNSPEMRTLQVGLAVFRQESGTDWELLTAAATYSILPIILIFLFVQKQYIQGIARSGLK